MDKNNFKLYFWLGIAKYNLSLEEAIEDLNKALKIDKIIVEQSIRDCAMKIFICLKKSYKIS
ncbi:hypothetical protein L8V92_00065 [Campylobacter lari]|nr:hypothetical protein [Campylobacter lari]MCV3420825.1 hypothetical protein [Campylobacter lari]